MINLNETEISKEKLEIFLDLFPDLEKEISYLKYDIIEIPVLSNNSINIIETVDS